MISDKKAVIVLLLLTSFIQSCGLEKPTDQAIFKGDPAMPHPTDASIFQKHFCEGDKLGKDQFLVRVGFPGREVVKLGSTSLDFRIRECHKLSGCSEWSSGNSPGQGAILTDHRGEGVSRTATLAFLVNHDKLLIRVKIGNEVSSSETWDLEPDFLNATHFNSNTTMRFIGQELKALLETRDRCAKLSAKAIKQSPTPNENTRYFEAEMAGVFRY